jgi:hypothetical protein
VEEHKLQVLKTLYTQQQSTAHIVRERMTKITSGSIGLMVVIDGWLFTNSERLISTHTFMLMLSIIVIFVVSIYGIHARYKEFSAVASLIVRIETAMKIYEPGYFLNNEPLYPAAFQNLGKDDYEHGKNIFWTHTYILLTFGALSLGICLLV